MGTVRLNMSLMKVPLNEDPTPSLMMCTAWTRRQRLNSG